MAGSMWLSPERLGRERAPVSPALQRPALASPARGESQSGEAGLRAVSPSRR